MESRERGKVVVGSTFASPKREKGNGSWIELEVQSATKEERQMTGVKGRLSERVLVSAGRLWLKGESSPEGRGGSEGRKELETYCRFPQGNDSIRGKKNGEGEASRLEGKHYGERESKDQAH